MLVQLLKNTDEIIKKTRVSDYKGNPVIETLTNGYFIVDNKWTVKYWNNAAEKILGVAGKNIVGKNFWEHFEASIPVEFYSVYYKAFLQDIPVHFHEYWAEMDAWFDVNTWYSDENLYVSFKSSSDPYPDIPETRLKTLTELYKFVTEITNDCLWEWDLQTREIFWIDGGHKKVFGYPIENTLVPETFWQNCIHPDDRERILTKLKKILQEKDGSIWEDEYRFKKSNGDYVYVHDRGHIVYDDHNNPARIIGATQDIDQRILLQKQLIEERLTRQKAVLTALENERADIGRELHDNLGQILAVAKMYLQMGNKSEKKRKSAIKKTLKLVSEVMSEIRKISKVLVIPEKHIISLFDNIKILIKDIAGTHPIVISFHEVDITENDITDELQVVIFRIIQEQLNNILKHSAASHATIFLNKNKKELALIISDNGKGHNLSKEKNGVGIINIRSRAELHNGSVVINSQPGKGYELKVEFPLE